MHDVRTGGIDLIETTDRSTVRLWGEIDVAHRDEASAALANSLGRDLPVTIDTRDVTFIDSTGIAFLVQFCAIGAHEGLDVRLSAPSSAVADVIEMLGVRDVLTVDAADPATASAGPGAEPLAVVA